MEERIGEAFEFGEQLTVVGRKLQVGDAAPEFSLDYFDAKNGAMVNVQLSDSSGELRLLHVVNSLDTPVCHVGTHEHRWLLVRKHPRNLARQAVVEGDVASAKLRVYLQR